MTADCAMLNVQELKNLKFVALVDQLITKMGFDRVFAGQISPTSSQSNELTVKVMAPKTHYPHAWLAAQMLCTWKWPGGSVLSSFLPQLTSYAEHGDYSLGGCLLDSIINILLDGALSQGGSYEPSASNVSADSCEELESIKEPHLKALVLLFSTLFEKNIWGAEKAAFYFKTLVNRLFIGGSVNLHCLKILPPIIGIIISPLCAICDESRVGVKSDSFDGIQIHGTVEDWLQKTLSLTSLTAWQTGKGNSRVFCFKYKTIFGGISISLLTFGICNEKNKIVIENPLQVCNLVIRSSTSCMINFKKKRTCYCSDRSSLQNSVQCYVQVL